MFTGFNLTDDSVDDKGSPTPLMMGFDVNNNKFNHKSHFSRLHCLFGSSPRRWEPG